MTPPQGDRPHAFRNRIRSTDSPPSSQSEQSEQSEADGEGLAALRDILMENWETYAALAATGFLLAKGKGPALRLAAQRWGRAAFQMIAQMTADQLEARWKHREPLPRTATGSERRIRSRNAR
jgi:hypothetical protein